MNCRSCGAAIRWATTARGRKMPLDAKPLVGRQLLAPGIVWIDENGIARILGEDDTRHPGVAYFMPHWATCPNAREHRKS